MCKVAVIGDINSIYGFACIGIEIFSLTDVDLVEQKIKQLALGGYAIIFVTESVYARIKGSINAYRESVLPAIIPIPGVTDNTGEGMDNIKRFVEQAIGSDIF